MPDPTGKGFQKPPLRHARAVARTAPEAGLETESKGLRFLKSLVWLYFILLIMEGAFRKWWLPQFSNPLLIIRDPVVLWIYLVAHQQRRVPRHPLYGFFLFQAIAGALLVISQFVVLRLPPFVLFYGYRTLFLHLPLIFYLPCIFTRDDVIKLGRWVVLASIPMAALMAYQFNSPADAWINKTVGLSGGTQITAALGKIRPPGTFSFVSGPVAFFALVTAFVGYGLVSSERNYPRWMLLGSAVSIGLAVVVSGSRAAILSGAIVVAAWIFGAVAGKGVSNRVAHSLVVVLLAAFVLGQIESFQEGKEVLSERVESSSDFERASGGILGRFINEFVGPLGQVTKLPFFGAGLGVGTNVGASVLTGEMQFLLSETEFGRVLFEMGPLFGFLFIWFRLALTWDLGRRSLDAAKLGDLLPLLLFSACAMNLFNGQIAQPTTLGFTALVGGLCAASIRGIPTAVESSAAPRMPLRRNLRAA